MTRAEWVAKIDEITFFRSVFSLKDIPSTGLPEICISGRSNVGKSSVINRLANRHKLAKISRKPGKTRSLNYYTSGTGFYLVDLPGYGYAKISKTQRREFAVLVNSYLNDRRELRGLIQLLDSRHGPVSGDFEMLEWLKMWDGRVLYVLTKSDKLSASERSKAKDTYENKFGAENTVLFSAHTGMGVNAVWSWINEIVGLTI